MRVGSVLLMVVALAGLMQRGPAWAEIVTLKMPNGLTARADYPKGDPPSRPC